MPATSPSTMHSLDEYLGECRDLVSEEIRHTLALVQRGPARGHERTATAFYDLMLDYPLRAAKALRPALCIAVCRALGGRLSDVLPSAAVLELYHNAFLIHDDIEDESLLRRGLPTLHQAEGVPIAINVGDGMLALALEPLLANTRLLGLGKALRILMAVARMARETVEGQAMELEWIKRGAWRLSDRDYLVMAYKKTCWYTFVTPVLIGGHVAGAPPYALTVLRRFAAFLGVAFQIQDDLLNLEASEAEYGKEIGGDLAEGKRTLMLLHMMRSVSEVERAQAARVLARPRAEKTAEDVALLWDLIRRAGSIAHAREVARGYAARAEAMLGRAGRWLAPSEHREVIEMLTEYVVCRNR